MGRFFFSCSAAPVSEDVDPASSDTLEFKGEEGAVLASDRALVKAALLELQNAWPGSLGFDELLERAVKRSGVPVDGASQLAGHRKDLSGILFQAVFTGHVGIHKEPPKLATRVSRKPEASVIARKQAETGFMITNLRHRLIKLEDDKVRRFLRLLDGTRDIDDLTADFAAGAPPDAPPDDLTRETIERNLGHLANLALLVA
jgi:hypothetical protein